MQLYYGKKSVYKVGTHGYMPKEIIRPDKQQKELWLTRMKEQQAEDLGCTLYYLTMLELPYERPKFTSEIEQHQEAVCKGQYKALDPYYGAALNNLIEKLLSLDLEQRPTMEQILSMDFVRQFVEERGGRIEMVEEAGYNLQVVDGDLALTLPNDIPIAVAGEASLQKSMHYSKHSIFGDWTEDD